MASTDARPVPKKNVAYRHYFAIRKNDGTLITTWAGQDTELSADGASFADATNEATEIDTSGIGYIELTAGEMNYDCVIIKTTVTNTDALPYVVTLFPEETGDIRTDTTAIGGQAASAAAPVTVGAYVGGTAAAAIETTAQSIKTKTDGLNFTGTDVKATLDGEEVTPTAASKTGYSLANGSIVTETFGTCVAPAGFIAAATFAADVDAEARSWIGLAAANLDTQLADIPTVAEFNARTLAAADYVVVTDTLAAVTTVTNLTNAPTVGDFTAAMKTSITTAATAATPTVKLGNVAHGGASATLTLAEYLVGDSYFNGPISADNAFNDIRGVRLGGILASAITEGAAGRLAAAFSKWGDVATPVVTAASVNQTGDGYAYLGTNLGLLGANATALATAAELAKVPKSDGAVTWNSTALASLQSEANDALVAFTGDTGITLAKALEMLAAFMAGEVTASSAGGVTTYTYLKRDGSTTSFTSACTEADGTRATTGSLT